MTDKPSEKKQGQGPAPDGERVETLEKTTARLSERNRHLEALHAISLSLIRGSDLEATLNEIVQRVGGLVSSADAFMFLLTREKDCMEMTVGEGFYAEQVGFRLECGAGLVGKVWQEGRTLVVNDYRNWEGRHPDPRWRVLEAIAAVPIRMKDEVIGVIGVHHCRPGRGLDPDELDLIERFASLASAALEKAAYFEKARKELEAGRERQKDLLRFQRLFEHSDIPQLLIQGNRFVECNPAAVKLLGYDGKKQLLNAHPSDLSPLTQADGRDSAEKAEELLNLAEARGNIRFEWLHQKADGLVFPVEVSLTVISEGGRRLIHTAWFDITARKRAQFELLETNRRLNDIIDFLPDATLVIDKEGRVLAWNRAIEEMTGVKAEEMLGRGDYAYSVPFWGDRRPIMINLAMDWDEEKARHYEFVRQQGSTLVSESKIPGLKEGGAVLFNTARALYNQHGEIVGAIESVRDVTEHRRAEAALAESEQRLAEVVDFLPDPALVIDQDRKVQLWNKAMEDLTGIKAEDMVGKGDHEYALPFYGERRPLLIDMALDWEDGYEPKYLSLTRREDGVLISQSFHPDLQGGIYLSGTARVLYDQAGNHTGAIETLRNITLIKKVERELEEARRSAEQANQAKSEFLANMSHEIRTPMNAIIGLTHLTQKTNLDSKQRDYINKISHSAHSLLNIINDILDFSKIEAGRLDVETIDFDLEEVLDNVADVVGMRAQEKGLELLFHLDREVPRRLSGDPLRLGQVLINLTGNAVKFTEKGEIIVSVRMENLSPDRVQLQFSVKDTGPGMSRDHLADLFQAFTQADASTTRRFGGTGLGLTISQSLINLLGGRINVKSEPGLGSEFLFSIPFRRSRKLPPKTRLVPADLKKLKVLVVDDNLSSRMILSQMLEELSFEPKAVASAREGLAELKAAETDRPYDLILMDWKMPEMDGIKAGELIKKEAGLKRIPTIIMVTAYGREEVMNRAREVGLDGFLIKPVNESLLFDTIMDVYCGPDQGVPPVERSSVAEEERPDAKGPAGRVLLVEDNAINRQVAREVLEAGGLEVTEAENGRLAVEAVRTQDFDMVLMDLQMPVMDGYEATRALRDLGGEAGKLPIIAMTAHATTRDREKCLRAGMNEYLSKPIDPELLLKMVSRWLETKPVRIEPHPEASDRSPFPTPGIEVSKGLARVGGKKGLYLRLLTEFAADNSNGASLLETHLANGELEPAGRLVHTLKGVSGNLGMTGLQTACQNLESCLDSEDQELTQVRVKAFVEALAQVLESVRRFIDSAQGEAAGPAGPTPLSESPIEAMSELLFFLKEGDLRSREALQTLTPFLKEAKVEAAELADLIDNYDFDEALEKLASLAEALGISLKENQT